MSVNILSRPASCDHDSDIVYSVDDDYSDPSVMPLYSCGCRAVKFPVSRIYRPPTPEVIDLTCDSDTEALSDTDDLMDIDEIVDFVDEAARRRRQPDESWENYYLRRTRDAINRCLSEPHVISLSSWISDAPMDWGEFVDQNPTARVFVDWVIMRPRGEVIYDHTISDHVVVPTDRHVDSNYRLRYSVYCGQCAAANSPNLERIHSFSTYVDVDFDSNGALTIGCDLMPKHWIASRWGKVLAAKFEILAGGNSSSNCQHCHKAPYNVVGPFDVNDVVFDHSHSSFIGNGYICLDMSQADSVLFN